MARLAGTGGPRAWEGERDPEGHRTFFITWRVECDPGEGPPEAMECPGLASLGSWWSFGASNDSWAWCRPDCKVVMVEQPGEVSWQAVSRFDVTQTFSTKPPPWDMRRCIDLPIEDPMLEPQKISGGWVKDKEEATIDRFGLPIHNSAWEQLRGPQVEFDKSRGTLTIEQNRLSLDYDVLNYLKDTLNNEELWGFPKRSIKFTPGTFERKWYGSCTLYYTRRLEFEIRVKVGAVGTHFRATSGTVDATGTGYHIGDTLQIDGVQGESPKFTVTNASPGVGAVLAISLSSQGNVTEKPNNPTTAVGGGGTGCTINVTWASFTGQNLIGDWDRDLIDEGTKVLKGHYGDAFGTAANNWVLDNINGLPPNPADPTHFIRYKDRQDENTTVVLDGSGQPAGVVTPIKIVFAFFDDVDFVIQFETNAPHKLAAGDRFRIFGVDPPQYNGYWIVQSVIDPNTVDAAFTQWDASRPGAYVSGGILLNPKTATIPGRIHVEKYDELDPAIGDFVTLLGIPTVF